MPTPEQLSEAVRVATQVNHERALERAEHDSTAIAQLLDSDGWQYLKRRLTERRQQIRDTIADDDTLDDLATRKLRALAREYADLLNLPLQDRAVHTATLAEARRQDSGPARG